MDYESILDIGFRNVVSGLFGYGLGRLQGRSESRYLENKLTTHEIAVGGIGRAAFMTGMIDFFTVPVIGSLNSVLDDPGMMAGYSLGFYHAFSNKPKKPKPPKKNKSLLKRFYDIRVPDFGSPKPLRMYSNEFPNQSELY